MFSIAIKAIRKHCMKVVFEPYLPVEQGARLAVERALG
jgi:hypothetical protein